MFELQLLLIKIRSSNYFYKETQYQVEELIWSWMLNLNLLFLQLYKVIYKPLGSNIYTYMYMDCIYINSLLNLPFNYHKEFIAHMEANIIVKETTNPTSLGWFFITQFSNWVRGIC